MCEVSEIKNQKRLRENENRTCKWSLSWALMDCPSILSNVLEVCGVDPTGLSWYGWALEICKSSLVFVSLFVHLGPGVSHYNSASCTNSKTFFAFHFFLQFILGRQLFTRCLASLYIFLRRHWPPGSYIVFVGVWAPLKDRGHVSTSSVLPPSEKQLSKLLGSCQNRTP